MKPFEMKTSELIMELVWAAVVIRDQVVFAMGRSQPEMTRRDAIARELDARVRPREH